MTDVVIIKTYVIQSHLFNILSVRLIDDVKVSVTHGRDLISSRDLRQDHHIKSPDSLSGP